MKKTTEKKVTPVTKKKVTPKIKKPVVQMVSYSIEMTIPTGAYANIKPQIVVKGGSIQEAHDFVAPHMNKLWKEYFMINERRPEPPKTQPAYSIIPPTYPTQAQIDTLVDTFDGKVIDKVPVQPPESSVAFVKATQAIDSCLSLEALDLIQAQVIKSVKLTHEDKEKIMPMLEKKSISLTFPDDEK